MSIPTVNVIIKLLFLGIFGLIFCYTLLFTFYVPDAYVFVQYAHLDNIDRNITLGSLLNNNVGFDLLTVTGDALSFDSPLQWLLLITIFSLLLFLIKYSILLFTGRFEAVLIVYAVSFFYDLNQFRFNLAVIILFGFVWVSNRYLKIFLLPTSFFSHIIPATIYVVMWVFVRPYRFLICGVPIFVALIYVLASGVLMDSRFNDYLSKNPTELPKILIVFFPAIYYLLYFRSKVKLLVLIHNYAFSCIFIGIFFFFINSELTARFFELSFIFVSVLNVYKKRSTVFDLLLLSLSLSIIISRLINGIHTESDFISFYKL